METGRTFGTLFSDVDLRYKLHEVGTVEEFNRELWAHAQKLAMPQKKKQTTEQKDEEETKVKLQIVTVHS